jgi:hypothetical protein
MLLSWIGIRNYKCLGQIRIPLTPIHVLIGPNDAGKTSVMEAITSLYASLYKPPDELFPKPWQGRELVRFGATELAVEIFGEWDSVPIVRPGTKPAAGIRYGLAVGFEQSGHSCSVRNRWLETDAISDPGRPARFLLSTDLPPHFEPSKIEWIADESDEIQKIYDDRRDESLKALMSIAKPVEKYSLEPKAMKMPAPLDAQGKFHLNQNGLGLPALLDDFLSYDSRLFEKIKADFCRYFPQFTDIKLPKESLTVQVQTTAGPISIQQTGKRIDLLSNGHEIAAQQASDGAILFLGILALAHLPEPPPLLLLEEPENGIYPKRLGEVITLLKQLVARTDGQPFPQIILSTHSPYVLSFFEPEEVTFLSRPSGKPDAPVRARPLRDAPNIRGRMGSEFNLGELWYNLDEKDLFHDE